MPHNIKQKPADPAANVLTTYHSRPASHSCRQHYHSLETCLSNLATMFSKPGSTRNTAFQRVLLPLRYKTATVISYSSTLIIEYLNLIDPNKTNRSQLTSSDPPVHHIHARHTWRLQRVTPVTLPPTLSIARIIINHRITILDPVPAILIRHFFLANCLPLPTPRCP